MPSHQTVPPLPLLWWGVRATLPCKPQPSEKPRCETEKAAPRAWPVRSRYVGTCVSPLQSAEGPKDVNKVMARFARGSRDRQAVTRVRGDGWETGRSYHP